VRILGASLLALSCAAPLDAPSAYTGERFLCAPEHAAEWDAHVSACSAQYRTDRSCPGVTSIRGELNGEIFVADSRVSIASYEYDPTKPTSLGYTRFDGASPYFKFGWSTEGLTMETTPPLCPAAGTSLFEMAARGSSNLQRMNFDSCEFTRSTSGLYLAYRARFTVGGFVEGCAQLTADPLHL